MLGLIVFIVCLIVVAAVLGLTVHPLFWLLVLVAVAVALADRSRL